MHDFQILFDHGERSELLDPIYAPYGKLGFPHPPPERPWVYANFVQTLDGITSLLGVHASGSDISQSLEDRWLMDLLRAHADAVLIGAGTLILERNLGRPRPRGPVFRIVEPTLQQLRAKLRKGTERNVFVTATGNLQFSDFAVFDGDRIESAVLTSPVGGEKLEKQSATHPHVKIIAAGEGSAIDLHAGLQKIRSELGVQHLLCEGGPRLYGNLMRAGLIDEKFVTVAPFDAGQTIPSGQETVAWEQPAIRPTIFSGEGLTKERMARWSWVSCRRIGDYQFNRYRKVR